MQKIIKNSTLTLLLGASLAGCSSNEAKEPNNNAINSTPVSSTSVVNDDTKSSASTEKQKKLSADETLALEYINTFINGTDLDAKKKFVEEKIYSQTKPLFEFAMDTVADQSDWIKDPEVIESTKFKDEKQKQTGSTVLINSKDDPSSEIIVLTVNGTIATSYSPSDNTDQQKLFDDIRKDFKTPIPK